MTRALPTDRQIDELVRGLGELQPRRIAKTLKAAIKRDKRGGSTIPDGYPRGKGDGPGGPPRLTIDADPRFDLPEESIEFTSVELAIIARERTPRDALHEATTAGVRHLVAAVENLDRLRAQIERLDCLDEDLETTNERRCAAMARVNVFEPFHKRREINGTAYDLGRWAYEFVIRADRLPTLDECRRHNEGRNVRQPA